MALLNCYLCDNSFLYHCAECGMRICTQCCVVRDNVKLCLECAYPPDAGVTFKADDGPAESQWWRKVN